MRYYYLEGGIEEFDSYSEAFNAAYELNLSKESIRCKEDGIEIPLTCNRSIVTNFGCPTNCWYCIWKNHSLKDCNEPFEMERVKFFIESAPTDKISISGGGDCLHQFDKYEKSFWEPIFALAKKYKKKIDVHSRTPFWNDAFWKKINKVVVSSDFLTEDMVYLSYLAQNTKVRVVHVVTKDSTPGLIAAYCNFLDTIGAQFTLKRLVGYDDGNRWNEIKKTFPNIFFLEEGDYNIYYMPDNEVYDFFLQ